MKEQTNAADPKQLKEAKLADKDRRRLEIDDVKAILNSAFGRRFVYRYLVECGVFKTSFTGNSETFFNEGRRQVGLILMNDINDAHPDAYALLIRENRKVEE